MYEVINVEQGSQEWHDLRAKYYKTASRTPSVLSLSPFMSREQLAMNLRGEYEPFYSNAMKQGNVLEDMVRIMAEDLLSDSFMPMVAVNGEYLASLDGLNFDKDTLIEIKVSEKTYNDIKQGTIPEHYLFQIYHQMLVVDTVKTGYLVAYNPKTKDIAISKVIERDYVCFGAITDGWEKFDQVKDTLKVIEFDMSDNKYFMDTAEEFKKAKEISDVAIANLNRVKEKLYGFYKGGKTFGGGVSVSFTKESKSTKWANVCKDNKELLKDVDMSKYETKKESSYKVLGK